MILVLNELSYSNTKIESINDVKLIYKNLFDLILNINNEYNVIVDLKFSKSLNNEIFHDNYPFSKWINENLDKSLKSSILSMITKKPFIHEYPYYKCLDLDIEEDGKGIGYAYENEELLLSFESDNKWKINLLNISQQSINEESEDYEEIKIEIRNCHDEQSKKVHSSFIKERYVYHNVTALKNIINGKLLWDKRESIFPNLIFCSSVENYIINIQSGDILENLLKRLNEYENYFKQWNNGDFDKSKLKGKPREESNTRLNKFKNQLTINCPDNFNRLFSLHCNYGIHGFRLYFYPDTGSKKCYIGYIGKKIV